MISKIKDFYFYYYSCIEIKPENTKEMVVKTSECKRMNFVNATADALLLLISNVALAIFSALAVIATLGRCACFKDFVYKNAYESLVHAGSIPISLIGIISPQVINQNFLELSSSESIVKVPDDLSVIVDAKFTTSRIEGRELPRVLLSKRLPAS